MKLKPCTKKKLEQFCPLKNGILWFGLSRDQGCEFGYMILNFFII